MLWNCLYEVSGLPIFILTKFTVIFHCKLKRFSPENLPKTGVEILHARELKHPLTYVRPIVVIVAAAQSYRKVLTIVYTYVYIKVYTFLKR